MVRTDESRRETQRVNAEPKHSPLVSACFLVCSMGLTCAGQVLTTELLLQPSFCFFYLETEPRWFAPVDQKLVIFTPHPPEQADSTGMDPTPCSSYQSGLCVRRQVTEAGTAPQLGAFPLGKARNALPFERKLRKHKCPPASAMLTH